MIQWFRTDKILFPGTGVDVSLVISVIFFVLCTVVVAVKRVMSRKRAKVRMRRIEKDQQAEKEAEQQRENVAENLETETVQGEKNGSERCTEERGSSSESVTFAAAAGGTEKLDSQIRSRSDLLKNLEASQRVDRILELYYGN